MVQLAVAVATVTLVSRPGIEGSSASAPAIFLSRRRLAALPAGRLMGPARPDPGSRRWLVPASRLSRHGASALVSSPRRSSYSDRPGRLAQRDDPARPGRSRGHVPARATRPRHVVRALLGALSVPRSARSCFRPLLAGKELDTHALIYPLLAAGGIMVIGLALVLMVRPTRARSLASSLRRRRSNDETRALRESSRGRACSPRSSLRSRASAAWSP